MIIRALVRVWCLLFRWKVVRTDHDIPRPCVVVAAPHTSNWDFLVLMATTRLNDVDMRWLGKRQMFDGPLAPLFRALGGIPVDREAGVPIQTAYVDGWARTSGFGPHLVPTGDVSADMDVIRAFYADKTGIRPDRFLTPRLREEASAEAA